MNHIRLYVFIQFKLLFEPPVPVCKTEPVSILCIVCGMNKFGDVLLQFIFIIVHHISQAFTELYYCNHLSSIELIFDLISSTLLIRIFRADSWSKSQFFTSAKSFKMYRRLMSWL